MAYALAGSVPVIAFFMLAEKIEGSMTFIGAAGVLVLASIYVITLQLVMAENWLPMPGPIACVTSGLKGIIKKCLYFQF